MDYGLVIESCNVQYVEVNAKPDQDCILGKMWICDY